MRSPLTEKFLRIVTLRDEVKTWPQDEQDFFLDMLIPEPRKAKKSTAKKPNNKPSKSKRASGLGDAIKDNLQRRDAANAADGIPCTYQYPKGGINSGQICDEALHNPVHEITGGYASYHAFQPASTEQSAVVSGG